MVNQTPEQKERDQIDALLRHASWVVQDNKKTGFAALKTARARLKVYRHAVLRHAFESKLTAQWREEYKEKFDIPQQFLIRIQQEREGREQQFEGQKHSIEDWKASGNEGKNPKKKPPKGLGPLAEDVLAKLPAFPVSRSWQQLGLLTPVIGYGASAKFTASGSVPVNRMGNRQNGSIDWADFVYTSDQEEIDKYSLKKNDALFSRTISSELIGKTAKYRSKKFQNYPFPSCSIAEQEVIIETLEEKLSLTDESIKDVLFQLKRSEILCQSILKKACSGQLIKGALDAS